ncbi:MAG: hypothetical protein JW936_01100 [Sedimentisphaerales bacterium]|nr:hypothetical protein [Sedimentisphaerales bacterium]
MASTLLITLLGTAFAAPKPALVPQEGVWQLDIEFHGQPRQITITLPGDTQPRSFWYLPYTITNNTGQEVRFYPQFDLLTDTLRLYHAGEGVRRPVFEAIRQRYGNTIPLLEPESMVTGRILLGADNARDSVVIFPDFDPEATSVSIFIAGLSNENVTVPHPTTIDQRTGQAKQILLRKTLQLQYRIVGDAITPRQRVMLYHSMNWIMR